MSESESESESDAKATTEEIYLGFAGPLANIDSNKATEKMPSPRSLLGPPYRRTAARQFTERRFPEHQFDERALATCACGRALRCVAQLDAPLDARGAFHRTLVGWLIFVSLISARSFFFKCISLLPFFLSVFWFSFFNSLFLVLQHIHHLHNKTSVLLYFGLNYDNKIHIYCHYPIPTHPRANQFVFCSSLFWCAMRVTLCRRFAPTPTNRPNSTRPWHFVSVAMSVCNKFVICVFCTIAYFSTLVCLGSMECGRCHSVCYCSAEHQKFDWKTHHKAHCKQLSSAPTRVEWKFEAIGDEESEQRLERCVQNGYERVRQREIETEPEATKEGRFFCFFFVFVCLFVDISSYKNWKNCKNWKKKLNYCFDRTKCCYERIWIWYWRSWSTTVIEQKQ